MRVITLLESRGHAVHNRGLVVHPDHPWLAASPDGILDGTELLKIKCPFKSQMSFEELLTRPNGDIKILGGWKVPHLSKWKSWILPSGKLDCFQGKYILTALLQEIMWANIHDLVPIKYTVCFILLDTSGYDVPRSTELQTGCLDLEGTSRIGNSIQQRLHWHTSRATGTFLFSTYASQVGWWFWRKETTSLPQVPQTVL